METPIFVKVNLKRFIENARSEGEPPTPTTAKLYLQAWGIKPCIGNVWRCNEVTLSYLRPDEIEEVIRLSGDPETSLDASRS